ncbi:MarR family winged helix-turn-helix transcriptional regulator [Crassaminicella profunda]|uniref:MarR family winged helix-turn-helix transcriptional regulator n=1 Tax=Crassaminicella profunda TaxID=1286698 RepID=UPI001CA61290|nr:MarR family winged helix-turn-helix transcriptional regulator [Crassaminicella profunda]QZY56386.1 MarR family winged helix-turn-helix transcriptional regulator [Crassaminicella profunda]
MEMKFITKDQSVGKHVDIISRYLFYYINKQVEPYHLQKHSYKILIELYHQEGLCQEDLVTLLKLSKADIAKSVKKLIGLGYIHKEKDTEDKRIHHLYLTEKSLAIKDSIISILEDTSTILSQNISKEDIQITKKVMQQMAENILHASHTLKNS